MAYEKFRVSYLVWKQLVESNEWKTYILENGVDRLVWSGNRDYIYESKVEFDNIDDYETNFGSSAITSSLPNDAVASILGLGSIKPKPTSSFGHEIVALDPSEGSKENYFSINWCDKTTWFEGSVQVNNEILSNSGDNQLFSSSNEYWIDVVHGKLTREEILYSNYQPTITVGTSSKQEIVPDTQGGDYTINYESGTISFSTPLSEGSYVTASYYYASGSQWTIIPPENKFIRMIDVEAQFDKGITLMDTAIFQLYGYVEYFAPQLTPVPYPTGTLIPLGSPVKYKTFRDYINETNTSYPIIPKMGDANWRGIQNDVSIFRWNYVAATDLYYSKGMRIQISHLNDIPHSGTYATAAIYAIGHNE